MLLLRNGFGFVRWEQIIMGDMGSSLSAFRVRVKAEGIWDFGVTLSQADLFFKGGAQRNSYSV